jgi:hypothetical protein
MRITCSVLFGVTVLLSIGWVGASSADSQDCCHPSAGKSQMVTAPAPTPTIPMPTMNTSSAREAFNASSQKVRVIALLSPTCTRCQAGHAVVGRLLTKFPSRKLQAILVWEPMRDGDNAIAARQEAESVRDERISQGWDGSRSLGRLFGETLNLHEIAWDVYLVYKPGIKWEGSKPPAPTFWMHQLEGVDPNRLLCADPMRLTVEVGKLIEQSN